MLRFFIVTLPCRLNAGDLSTDTPAPSTAPKPAYEMLKEGGGQNSYEHELVKMSPETDPRITSAEDNDYEIPSQPISCQPPPAKQPVTVAPPTDEDVGVAGEGKGVVVYDHMPGDL